MIAPVSSSAPSRVKSRRAPASAASGGCVRKAIWLASRVPQSASSSASGARSAASISAGGWAGRAPSAAFVHIRKQVPGATRPARPRRWSASARDTGSVTSRLIPDPGSNRARRARPQSTTTRMSSIVSDVSAIDVASTSLRPVAAGAMAARCALNGIDPCSGHSTTSSGSAGVRAAATRDISPAPGRNTSTPPAVSSSARRTRPAHCVTNRVSFGGGVSSQRVSTGNACPSERTVGAPPISAATGAVSSVADIARRIRSSRSAPRTSSASASPRSALSERSWNSSKITAPMPPSPGSNWIMRVRMPSVTTSIWVEPDTLLSPRMRYPTVRPTGSPSVAAMRSAAARAAIRRGSSMTIRPSVSPASSIASGTRVVLPAPGGASSTAMPASARAAISPGRAGSMGSASFVTGPAYRRTMYPVP